MEKKKIRFNGMDFLIIIVAVAILAVGAYLLFGDSGVSVSSDREVKAMIKVEIVAQEQNFVDVVKSGDKVEIGEKNKSHAVVEKVDVATARNTGYDIVDGKVLRSEIPGEYDVTVTLVGDGTESEDKIKIGDNVFKVGQNAVLNSKNWAGYGYIVEVGTEEKN